MPFTPNFSISESSVDWANLVFTDTSTGSDGSIDRRVIYIQKANDEYLSTANTDYIPWPYADQTIDVNGIVTLNYSLLITVDWLDAMGAILYTKTYLYLFIPYAQSEELIIIQALTAKPNIQQDWKYWLNLGKLQLEISNAQLATEYMQQVMSQAAANRATNLVTNQIINY